MPMTDRQPTAAERAAARREFYRRNFRHFAAEQLKIRDIKAGPLLPLILTEGQDIFYAKVQQQLNIQGYVRGVLLKSRQFGGSTITEALLMHQAALTDNFHSLLVAADDKSTRAVFRIAQLMHERLSDDIRPLVKAENREELHFANPDKYTRGRTPGRNSRMEFQTAKNALAGTGTTRQALHLTELAKWDECLIDDLTSSLLPTIHRQPNTWLIMESTAFEGGEYFREMCEKAEAAERDRYESGHYAAAKLDYFFVFAPWWIDSKNSAPLLPGEEINPTPQEKKIAKYADGGFQKEYPHLNIPRHTISLEQFKYRQLRIDEVGEDGWEQEYPCVAEGMRVGTHMGIVPIQHVRVGDRTSYGAVTDARCSGIQPLYRLRTAHGYSVTGTSEHPVKTPSGAVALGESLGKIVSLGQPQFAGSYHEAVWWEGPLRQSVHIDEDFGRLLGYFMGDGSLVNVNPGANSSGGTLSVCCDGKDPDVVDDVERLVTRFVGPPSIRRVGTKRGGVELRKHSSVFVRIARGLNIYSTAKPHRKVCVPECIWRSPRAVVKEFLSGLFEADACKRKTRNILLFSKHRAFLEDVQVLLLAFGIQSRLVTAPRRNKRMAYIANELSLQAEATNAFGERIGFIGSRKRGRFAPPVNRRYANYARPMTLTDTVVAVDDLGISRPVYDLTVEGGHEFDANGVRVHNCSPAMAWISRDRYVFDRNALHELKRALMPPREFIDIDAGPRVLTLKIHGNVVEDQDYIAIWKRPEPGRIYDIGIDVAMGTEGGNWSVGEVLDRETHEQVAEYHKHIEPIDYARELYWLGKFYNTAQLVVEMNGPGIVTGHDLDKMGYPYIYIWRNVERFGLTPTSYAGWQTNQKSKQIIVSLARHHVNHKETAIHSRVLHDQMWHFVQIGDDYRAARGCDDAVMGYMIAIIGGEHEGRGVPAARPLQKQAEPQYIGLHDRWDPSRQNRPRVANELRELKGMR